MSKFPTETLIEIFKFLHFQQKLECMLVCRAWAQILRVYLFETIELSVTSSFQSFDQRLDFLLKNEKSGSQQGNRCKRFRIHNTNWHKGKVDAVAVATSFPNLNFLQFDFNIEYDQEIPFPRSSLSEPEPNPFAGWRTSLETLIDENFKSLSFSNILTTGVFSRLTTLTILPKYTISSSSYYPWFPKLKNAPALTTFTIDGTYISYKLLEELHNSTPKLTSLTLIRGFSSSENDNSNDLNSLNIIPAEKIKVFKTIDTNASHGVKADTILLYAKMKYPNLDELFHREDQSTGYNRKLFSESAWAEFIPAIGPGLTRCTINQRFRSNVTISQIGKYMMQLEHLDISVFNNKQSFNKVTSSQAFYSLVSLSLHRLPSGLKITKFRQFTKLKELSLDFSNQSSINEDYHPIVFDDIVDELPKNIDTLSLKSVNITLAPKPTQGYSSIVRFKLYDSMILYKKIPDFMTQHFPMLKSLILNRCVLAPKFELPNHHLSYVEITPSRTDITYPYFRKSIKENHKYMKGNCTHLKITMNDQMRTYKVPKVEYTRFYRGLEETVDANDWPIQRVLKASDPDDNLQYFHFVCARVDKFCCFNYILLL